MKEARARIVVLLGVMALAGAGCGGGSTSSAALRSQANAICKAADQRLRSAGAVRTRADARRFLARGLHALEPELRQLDRLSAPQGVRRQFAGGVRALAGEVAALHATVGQLRSDEDLWLPFRQLQERLGPLERQADAAWSALGIPACLDR